MKTFKNLTNTFASLLITALLTGCGWNHGEQFDAPSKPTSVGNFSQAQSAEGAKEDGMLYDMHFHGSELTSLGQGKLDLIAKGTTTGDPVLVYMNMPHDLAAARQAAVTDYLKNQGIGENKIIVAEGPNPNPMTPSAYNLGGLYKQDGTSYNGQAAIQTSSGLGSAAGGSH